MNCIGCHEFKLYCTDDVTIVKGMETSPEEADNLNKSPQEFPNPLLDTALDQN